MKRRVSLGFAGGQVLALKLDEDQLDGLRRALSSGSESWQQVDAEDGAVLLNLAKVLFLRVDAEDQRIGF